MKDFNEFVALASSQEAHAAKEAAAKKSLSKFVKEDGTVDQSDIVNIAVSCADSVAIEILRLYHDWSLRP